MKLGQQLKIKQKSVITRRNIFYQGTIISLIGLILFKPFDVCL